MNPRLAVTAVLCREVALPASVLVWLVAFGPPVIENGAEPIVDRLAVSVSAGAKFANDKFANKLPPIALGAADLATASKSDIVTANKSATEAVTTDATTPPSHDPAPIVTAALTDSSETPRPETPPEPAASSSTASLEPSEANLAVGSTELPDECLLTDSCVDRYLWSLYQRTPKEDTVTTKERGR